MKLAVPMLALVAVALSQRKRKNRRPATLPAPLISRSHDVAWLRPDGASAG